MLQRICFGLVSASVLVSSAVAADLTVGFVTALSGPGSSTGVLLEKGILAGHGYVNTAGGFNIKLIQLDDASDPSASTRNARKLIEDEKVDVLIGTSGTPGTVAMAVVAAETKTPMISLTPVTQPPSPNGQWMISIPQPPDLMVATVVERMKKDSVNKAAYIGFNDSWGDIVYESLKKDAPTQSVEILSNERYARADRSVVAQILKILSKRPDAVIAGGAGTAGSLPYLTLAERGYKGKLYGTYALINPDFVRVGGAAVEGVIASTGPVVVAEQLPDGYPTKIIALTFREAFQRANNAAATDAMSAYSFDAWLVFLDAAKRATQKAQPGTAAFRAALNTALQSTHEVVGTHGVYNYSPGSFFGVDKRASVLVQLQKGRWTLID